jgi:hypothetical protein
MYLRPPLLIAGFLLVATGSASSQQAPPEIPQTDTEKNALLSRVVENQKKNDEAQNFLYQRLERKEIRKGGLNTPAEVKVWLAIPAGTGIDHIDLNQDGKPGDLETYRAQLEKLANALSWVIEDGSSQREALDKADKHQKNREELIDATRQAFLYTYLGSELRGDRTLFKYRLEPNPNYKPAPHAGSREHRLESSILTKVRGNAWIDPAACELAKVEVEVTEDISIGGFLAKIYKGSHVMQESYEVAPGIWLPSYSQFDFDGRKFFISFALHERTFYSQYRRAGPPKEALAWVRAELNKPPAGSDP